MSLVDYVSNFPMTSAEVVVHRKDCPRVKGSRHLVGILGARSLVEALQVETERAGFPVRACRTCAQREAPAA